jgi:hypothetical protein
VRHRAPLGCIGVWPELAVMRHSCAPNTSMLLLPGGAALFHATTILAAGSELTFNKLGK